MILDNVNKLEDVFSLTTEDLVKINGIGEIVAKYFVTEIKNWKSTYEFLLSIGMKIKAEEKGDKLKGKSFCFTGKLDNIKRPAAEKLVKKLGGEISSVNKTLTYLVTNDTSSGSSKNKKAAELGVQVITEQQFLDMVK
jgi:DNA ligase (NAD+)